MLNLCVSRVNFWQLRAQWPHIPKPFPEIDPWPPMSLGKPDTISHTHGSKHMVLAQLPLHDEFGSREKNELGIPWCGCGRSQWRYGVGWFLWLALYLGAISVVYLVFYLKYARVSSLGRGITCIYLHRMRLNHLVMNVMNHVIYWSYMSTHHISKSDHPCEESCLGQGLWDR